LEPFEFLNGAPVVAFGLGLIAQEQGPTIGLADHPMEAFSQEVIAILGASDFDIPITGEFLVHQDHGVSGGVEGLIEAGGEEAGFEARGAEESLLGEGNTLNGEEFLRVDGLVDGDEVLLEMGDLIEFFEADDGEGGGSESMLTGVLGRAGLALRGGGAGGFLSIQAVGVELFLGDVSEARHKWLSYPSDLRYSMGGRANPDVGGVK
jgi:hypothetical protein